MRVLIAAGGTGGHIYPGLTVARMLADQGAEVLFVGTRRGLENDVVPRAGFTLRTVSSRSIPRRLSPKVIAALGTAAKGTWEAAAVIREFRPHAVLGTGGYVSGPVLLMASLLRYPTIIHEQNAFPGITNRMLGRFVTRVALGFAEAAPFFPAHKVVVTGNPVRPEVLAVTRAEGLRAHRLQSNKKTLVITGGSQGARSINRAVIDAAPIFHARADLQVLHATGKGLYAEVRAELAARGVMEDTEQGHINWGNIRIVPYIYALPEALAAADLVVGRGGALSSAEYTARGIPAILVPYPYSSEDHQVRNARVLEQHGAARVLLDHEISGERLGRLVTSLLDSPSTLAAMAAASKKQGRPQAALALVELTKSICAPRD